MEGNIDSKELARDEIVSKETAINYRRKEISVGKENKQKARGGVKIDHFVLKES